MRCSAADLAIMELSSFQLELMHTSPHIAAVLNITPNHLDRHVTMAAYTAAKTHILAHQTDRDIAVLGREDPGASSLAGHVAGRLFTFGKDRPRPGLDLLGRIRSMAGNDLCLQHCTPACRIALVQPQRDLRCVGIT